MIINTIIDGEKQRITLTPLKYKGFEKYLLLDESIKNVGYHYLFNIGHNRALSVVKQDKTCGYLADEFEIAIIGTNGNCIKPIMVGLLTNKDVLMLLDRLLSINYLGSDVRDLLPKNVGMLKEYFDKDQEDNY